MRVLLTLIAVLAITASASAINGATNYAIVSASKRVCFLTTVHFRDVDASSEDVWCTVYYEASNPPNTWVLEAHSEDDSDAWCAMRCITWSVSSRVE